MRALPGARGRVDWLDGSSVISSASGRARFLFGPSRFKLIVLSAAAPLLRAAVGGVLMPRRPSVPLIRDDLLRNSAGFDRMIDARREEAEVRDRWLRQYLFAVSLIVRLPGGPGYRPDFYETSRFIRQVWNSNPRPATAVLGLLLDRLGKPEILDEIPRARELSDFKLPGHVRYRLRRLDPTKTLRTTLGCLDRLLIAPVHPSFANLRDGCVLEPLPPRRYDFSIR